MRKGGNPPQSALRLPVGLPAPPSMDGGAKVGGRCSARCSKLRRTALLKSWLPLRGELSAKPTEGDCRMGANEVKGSAKIGVMPAAIPKAAVKIIENIE